MPDSCSPGCSCLETLWIASVRTCGSSWGSWRNPTAKTWSASTNEKSWGPSSRSLRPTAVRRNRRHLIWYRAWRETGRRGSSSSGKEFANKSMQSPGRGFSFSSLLICFFTVVPKVEVTPKSVTKMQGSNVKAVCTASGYPPPEIQWNLDMLSTHPEVSPPMLFNRPLLPFYLFIIVVSLWERSRTHEMPSGNGSKMLHVRWAQVSGAPLRVGAGWRSWWRCRPESGIQVNDTFPAQQRSSVIVQCVRGSTQTSYLWKLSALTPALSVLWEYDQKQRMA